MLYLCSSCELYKNENTKSSKIADSTSTFQPPVNNIAATISITANDLSKEYLANEIKADHAYNRREITVTGDIADIKKSLNGDAYVILVGVEKFTPVQCYLEYTDAALVLNKGNRIKLKGTCLGLHANVILEKCVVIK